MKFFPSCTRLINREAGRAFAVFPKRRNRHEKENRTVGFGGEFEVSQTALAGKWTGTVPTQTRADWAAEYDTPTVGPAATRITADLLDQPNGNALMTYFPSVRVQVLDVEGDWVKVRVGDADSGSRRAIWLPMR